MDSGHKAQVHVSIQKGLSFPPLQKCNNCCSPGKFHCPFCSPHFFKPTKRSRVGLHLDNHLKRALYVGEYTIHRCSLVCRKHPHYHCLYCTSTLIRRRDFINHLPSCRQVLQQRLQKLSQIQPAMIKGLGAPWVTPGERDTASCDGESINKTFLDSESPIVPKSNECGTVGKRSMEPESFKCHQTVQTNIEKPQDCDEYYFMNLVKMFKKLSPQKKAEVRMKIERLLFEAEFE
ncbi:uncharacterized protein LOC121185777 isoform X2 [Toxotes jaculatrix]|uniref:uncharacterized protein LOC121185777 isoform X2 n=1 Tax=Toxotes jaculatrix TaxID=941984 RepID=UPI001B3A9EB7|nr:uncharacterized protein LOC121185777 isoform X2 [Toxotes jaculatrix]